VFNTGKEALEVREQAFQFVRKKVFEESKVEKQALLAVCGSAVEIKSPPFKVQYFLIVR